MKTAEQLFRDAWSRWNPEIALPALTYPQHAELERIMTEAINIAVGQSVSFEARRANEAFTSTIRMSLRGVVKCAACDGKGHVTPNFGELVPGHTQTCSKCEGRGVLEFDENRERGSKT